VLLLNLNLLQVPLGANGIAYFPFEDLCDRPLGAADYFGLFSKYTGAMHFLNQDFQMPIIDIT
jgi:predicted ATPase